MYGINLHLEYQFLTICLKSYILRKIFRFCENCAKNSANLIAFHAQILRKRFGHFVETLAVPLTKEDRHV